jgi:predicted nucleotidyltransferase
MRDIGRDELLRELAELKPRLQGKGITGMALFGSRARRDNRLDSDIDLVVEVDERQRFSMLDLISVGHVIEDRVGAPANLFMRRSLDPTFLREVAREQVVVF